MQLKSLLSAANISLNVTGINTKDELLQHAAEQLASSSANSDTIYGALLSREKTASTAMGNGIAIPHGRVASLKAPTASLIRLNNGIDFDAADQQKTDVYIVLAVPADCTEEHLQLLASSAELLSDDDKVAALRSAKQADEVIALLN